ncbi:hypothetical protein U9M48_038444 [Paspalum notatum var. saurae]|uniref:Uncharacterized protein n=1 Tax=Paspalum notatum var. saurae TaxID=547442 RepID=A0AAQ3UGV8_PASNO
MKRGRAFLPHAGCPHRLDCRKGSRARGVDPRPPPPKEVAPAFLVLPAGAPLPGVKESGSYATSTSTPSAPAFSPYSTGLDLPPPPASSFTAAGDGLRAAQRLHASAESAPPSSDAGGLGPPAAAPLLHHSKAALARLSIACWCPPVPSPPAGDAAAATAASVQGACPRPLVPAAAASDVKERGEDGVPTGTTQNLAFRGPRRILQPRVQSSAAGVFLPSVDAILHAVRCSVPRCGQPEARKWLGE